MPEDVLTFGGYDTRHRLKERLPVRQVVLHAVSVFQHHKADHLPKETRQLRVLPFEQQRQIVKPPRVAEEDQVMTCTERFANRAHSRQHFWDYCKFFRAEVSEGHIIYLLSESMPPTQYGIGLSEHRRECHEHAYPRCYYLLLNTIVATLPGRVHTHLLFKKSAK